MKNACSAFQSSLVLILTSVLVLPAQLRPTPPTIRVKITEVPVEVIVLDSKNRPVLDLREGDFTILENGVKQRLSHCLIDRFDQAPETPTGQDRIAGLSKFGPTGHRTILIVLGRGRHMWFDTLPVLTDFIANQLEPNDLVAVMAYNRATDFTTDRSALTSVLKRYQEKGGDIEATLELRQAGLQAVYGARGYDDELQAQIDSIFGTIRTRRLVPQRSPEAREHARNGQESLQMAERQAALDRRAGTEEFRRGAEGKFPIQLSSGGPDFDSFEKVEFQLLTDFSFEDYIFYRASTEQDVEHLFSAIQYLRFLDGDKHLIFLHNQGLVLPRLEHEKSLANLASDARVRLHAVQTGGTWVPGDQVMRGFSTGSGAGVAEMGTSGITDTRSIASFRRNAGSGRLSMNTALDRTERLAQMTGGLAFSHRDIRPSLEAINMSNQSAYLLGYRPQNEKQDGGFRSIEVKVNRPGLRVLHRRGYYAYEILRPYDRRQFMAHARIAAALEYADSIPDLKFSVETKAAAGESGQQPFEAVVGFLPPADIFSTDGAGLHRGSLAISYFVLSGNQELMTEAWDDLEMNLKEETFQRALAGGVRVHKKLTVPTDTSAVQLKVVLYDAVNDRLGSQEIRVKF